ncbi:regulator of G-protein signaling 22 [Elysia marginata]|uniref:Regulator of G-protein signaling 22 n=1 Tax=Elysia marginata TaxID=1093978 RepID=A0AAV4IXA4_9GAST|nr:regulator of G-protein signaling 22 [Elysia marginata]
MVEEQSSASSESVERLGDLSALLDVPSLSLTPSSRSGRPQSVRSTSSHRGATVRRGARRKTTGRAQATREDKNEFLAALSQSAMGHLSITMLYFYKYLLKHGEEDGMPQIDKDLFFYIEVQKFKDGSHANSDDEMLKRKVQSIVDCFLDSVYSPTLQIDIPADMHQKTLKATQRYLAGKETTPTLFDDAQFHVFKELLFYWAGYRRASNTPEDPKKRPITKYEKMLRKRMENIQNYQAPSSDFTLPSIPEGAIPSFTISLSEGVKFKEVDESVSGTPLPEPASKSGPRGSKAGIPEVDGLTKRSRGHSRRSSVIAK